MPISTRNSRKITFRFTYHFLQKKEGLHSVINTPHSVFAQMAGEYGLAGLAGFLVLYIMFFAKRHRHLSYGLPLLLFMTGMFFTEYWFEQLFIQRSV